MRIALTRPAGSLSLFKNLKSLPSIVALALLFPWTLSAQIQLQFTNEFVFTAAAYNYSEGDGNAVVTVTRKGSDRGKFRLQVYTLDATATNGTHYTGRTNLVIFNEFQTSTNLSIPIRDNTVLSTNPDPNFSVNLGTLERLDGGDTNLAKLGSANKATITIIDNDQTNAFNFEKTYYTIAEDDPSGQVQIRVRLDKAPGPDAQEVAVDWRTVSNFQFPTRAGSDYATDGSDFVGGSGTLTFGPNDTEQIITIPINIDGEVEFNEDFQVELVNPAGRIEVMPTDPNATNSPPPIPFALGKITTTTVTILFNGSSTSPQPAGAVDTAFNPDTQFNTTPGANQTIYAIDVQSDGKAVIGGAFNAYNASLANYIARVQPNGAIDPTFAIGNGANDFVSAVKVYPEGSSSNKIVVAGGFSALQGAQRKGVARLNPNGALDASFDPGSGSDGTVWAIGLQNDGKVVLGGEFTSFDNIPRNRLVRLNNNGTVDLTFDTGVGFNGPIYSLKLEPLPLLNFGPVDSASGSIDNVTNFNTGATSGSGTVAFSFGVVPGNLRIYQGTNLVFDTGPRLTESYTTNIDGFITTNLFVAFANFAYGGGTGTTLRFVVNEGLTDTNSVWNYSAVIQPSGTTGLIVGGNFTSFNNQSANGIVRLLPNGALDTNFLTGLGVDGDVRSVDVQVDGKIILAGNFMTYNSLPSPGLVRLMPNGLIDPTFQVGTGPDGTIFSVKAGVNSILIGGSFNYYNGTRRLGVARVLLDGSLDTSFMDNAYNVYAGLPNPDGFAPNGVVYAVASDLNDDVLIGGSFSRVGGSGARDGSRPRFNLARLVGGITPGPGNLEFIAPSFGVNENGGSLVASVRRVNGDLGNARVLADTRDGIATAGKDYTAVTARPALWGRRSPTGMISIGTTNNALLSVSVLEDTELEGDETINLFVSAPDGFVELGGEYVTMGAALGGRTRSTGVIVDNDFTFGTLNFTSTNYVVNEEGRFATLTVQRSGGSVGTVTVRYSTSTNGFATNETAFPTSATVLGDYTASSGQLIFSQGQSTMTFTIPIRDDPEVENDEKIRVTLAAPSGGVTLGTNAVAIVTIVDNDFAAGRLNFTANTFSFVERSNAVVQVSRTGGSVGVLSVQFETLDLGTTNDASSPFDYLETRGTLTWNHGDTSIKTIPIQFNDDGLVEGNGLFEHFGVRLFNPSTNGALGTVSSTTVRILEDDFYGTLSLNARGYLADENGTNVLVQVIRRGGIADTVSVDYLTRPGTNNPAGSGDYTDVSGRLTFAVGETSKSFIIPIKDDVENRVADGEKTVQIILTNAVRASLGVVTNATLAIIDDESFNAPAGAVETDFGSQSGANNSVNAVLLQPNGKVLVGGDFTIVNAIVRSHLARLNADGGLDFTFNPGGIDDTVRAIGLQSNGRVLAGGPFKFVTPVGQSNAVPRSSIARFTSEGVLDSTFDPGSGADNPIYAITETLIGAGTNAVRKLLVGGSFSLFNGVRRRGIAQLHENGVVDTSFDPGEGANGAVYAVTLDRFGRVLIGGEFTTVNGIPRNFIARLNQDGSLDATFDAGLAANGSIRAIAIQDDDKILIGGLFTTVSTVPRNSIARLNPDGTLDTSFDVGSGANGAVYALAIQLDGKILVGGDFTSFNGMTRNRITRLNTDGANDTSINFGSGANGFISSIVVQPDRRILIGGGFTRFNEVPRNYLARLHGGSIAGPGNPEFLSAVLTVNENGTNALVTVRRIKGTEGTITVDYSASAGTAEPNSDFTPVSGTITFRAGETYSTFTVPVINDNLAETNETVLLQLSNPKLVGSTNTITLGNQPVATMIIVSDDSVISFSQSAYNVNEDTPGGRATIEVQRIGETTTTISVAYSTAAGTATANSDYGNVSGTLTFAPGETRKFFSVGITNDLTVEDTETVTLRLTNPTGGAVLGQPNAVLFIFDNDFAPGIIRFANTAPTVNEGSGTAAITLSRTSGRSGVVTVNYLATNNTALSGSDFTATAGSVSFLDGEISKVIIIPILDDSSVEGNETIRVTLSNPTGGAQIGTPTTINLTIVDDDFGPGSLDQTFNVGTGADAAVRAIELQPDGKIIVGGQFTVLDGVSAVRLGRFNPDGSVDSNFSAGTGADSNVLDVAIQPSSVGKIIAGGAFRQFAGSNRGWVTRVLTNGFLDATFDVSGNENAEVRAVAPQPDGKIVVGGAFTTPRRGILRLTESGGADISFNPGTGVNGVVNAIALQPDGKVLIGGLFTQFDGVPRGSIARLNSNGLLDDSFVTPVGANGEIHALLYLPNGKVLIAGAFTSVGGTGRSRIARLNADGSVDASFVPGAGPNGTVYGLGIQADGKIVIGGEFTTVAGSPRVRVARLSADGTLDTTFDPGPGPSATVYALGVQADGQIVIGGAFNTVNGFSSPGIARLNGDPVIPDVAIRITTISRAANGEVTLTFTTQSGRSYLVEASTDLKQWGTLGTVAATGSSGTFTDGNTAGIAQRYYRIRRLTP